MGGVRRYASRGRKPANTTTPVPGEHQPPRLAWPWRPDARPELHWDHHRLVSAVIEALDDAHRHIDIEMYLCESGQLFDRFFDVLAHAVGRGVSVRMLLDGVGSLGLNDDDCQRLRQAGVALRFFNPLRLGHRLQALVRDHRKVIIIDNIQVFTGGMCIMDEYDQQASGEQAWLDAMVSAHGPVVDDCARLFEQAWSLSARGAIREVMRWRLRGRISDTAPLSPPGRSPMARLCAARGGRHNPLLVSLIRRVRLAEREVWLCTPYFFPPRALLRVLCHAARRGVSVTLTLPGPITDHPTMRIAGRNFYDRLLAAGVHIEEFQPRFIHLKAAIVDEWCTLGSSNYDRWNLRWNLDANLEFLDRCFLDAMKTARRGISEDSERIAPESWQARGQWQRWRERFWHWLGSRILRWLHSKKA